MQGLGDHLPCYFKSSRTIDWDVVGLRFIIHIGAIGSSLKELSPMLSEHLVQRPGAGIFIRTAATLLPGTLDLF